MPRTGRPPTPLATRFWSKVDKAGPVMRPELGPCWIWTGGRGRGGYGRIHDRTLKRTVYANRVSYELVNGPLAEGMHALHRCDNPPCVRPDHLFAGTLKDNHDDMVAKGRKPKGEQHWSRLHPKLRVRGERQGRAKLNDAAVRDIRRRFANGESRLGLANEYGVSWPVVDGVVKRTLWKHVA